MILNRRKKRVLPTEIIIKEGTGFLDNIKSLSIIIAVGFFVFKYIPTLSENTNYNEGVVFKNLSNQYESIENSYDSVLINPKNKTEILKNDLVHNVFVIDYVGTIMADEVSYLRKKVDSIILKHNVGDEVVLNITSPGGSVSGYGLVSSQIKRLKTAGIKVTATVDTVAASGGYMVAVVSDQIIAAPFAMVGSIGVVANVMIYEELLKNLGIQTNVYTSGDSKRTVVPSKIPTKDEELKLESQLEEIHGRFKEHVLSFRPDVDISKVFTGQAFLATDALKLGLVDKIGTSDELLISLYKSGNRLIKVEYQLNESFGQNLSEQVFNGLINSVKEELYQSNTIM